MTLYKQERLAHDIFKIEVEKIRNGWYSDKYFCNNVFMLERLSREGYTFQGESDIKDVDCSMVRNGDLEVEMQIFTRRQPFSLVAGLDEALAILKECTGYYENDRFINTYDQLEVEAVQDGTFVHYKGNSLEVEPVMKIRGRYRDFAKLETVLLGVIAEPTRIATNVYNTLVASQSKEILFFPARFTHYKLQALHGYAYSVAVQAHNAKFGKKNYRFVSTDEQGSWWGAEGVGTIAHATICSFLGDTAETMIQFCRIMPQEVARIALIDYKNDCLGESRKIMGRMFAKYLELMIAGKIEEATCYKLYAVRPDTSANMIDVSLCTPTATIAIDGGVSPRLIRNLRHALDSAYQEWDVPSEYLDMAKKWCKSVLIAVTGGFTIAKITEFERNDVPVDIYGVGSSLIENSKETNNDFTADIVRVKIHDEWRHLAKIGRCVCENSNLEIIV